AAPPIKPGSFGSGPTPAPNSARPQFRGLVHPAAVAVAVDAGGREITEPGKTWDRRDILAMPVEDRIASVVRRHGEQDVCHAGERGRIERVIAIKAKPAKTRAHRCRRNLFAATGAGDRPFRPEPASQCP